MYKFVEIKTEVGTLVALNYNHILSIAEEYVHTTDNKEIKITRINMSNNLEYTIEEDYSILLERMCKI